MEEAAAALGRDVRSSSVVALAATHAAAVSATAWESPRHWMPASEVLKVAAPHAAAASAGEERASTSASAAVSVGGIAGGREVNTVRPARGRT